MKRILTWITVLCALFALSMPAFAEENNSVAVVYGADFDYLVSIPASIATEKNTNKHYAEIVIQKALLPSNTAMSVYITGDSYKDGKWHINNEESTVAYHVMLEGSDGKYAAVQKDAELIRCTAGDTCPIAGSLCFVFGNASGVYNDILTFVITYTGIQGV